MTTSTDSIFLLGLDGQLERVPQSGYAKEAVLQKLIEDYPDLLSGDQIDPDNPPRWLLVSREAAIPDSETVTGRWSADHLLIDQFAIPTIVEVKRASDTRIRREVVGQMLEYAANATQYWPQERIRALAGDRYGGVKGLDAEVLRLLELDEMEDATPAVEEFWSSVNENLGRGRVRLLFVADQLPRELRRLIEFLNEKMPDVQVLGIELRQYAASNVRALVPRVVGQTEKARLQRSSRQSASRTTEKEFMDACPEWSVGLFQDILRHAREEQCDVTWGTKGFSIRVPRPNGERVSLFYGYPAGAVGHELPFIEIYVKHLNDGEGEADLRAATKRFRAFTEQGQFTLRCRLNKDAVADVAGILPTVWSVATRVRAGV